MKEYLPITGRARLRHVRKGKVLKDWTVKNLVMAAGKVLIAEIIESAVPTRPSHLALGDSDDAVADDETTLVSEQTRDALDSTTQDENEVTYNLTHTAAGAETVKEAWIFNDAAVGTMLCRFLTQEVTLDNGDDLVIDWTLNFGG